MTSWFRYMAFLLWLVNGGHVHPLSSSALSSSMMWVCPSSCKCSEETKYHPGLKVVCSKANLTSVPPNLPQVTTTLDLTGNRLPTLSNHTFSQLPNLRILLLADNVIRHLEVDSFVGLVKLIHLDLRNNYIALSASSYPPDVFKPLTSLEELSISDSKPKNRSRWIPRGGVPSGQEHVLNFAPEKLEETADKGESFSGGNIVNSKIKEQNYSTTISALRQGDSKTGSHDFTQRADLSYPDEAVSKLGKLKRLYISGLPNATLGVGFLKLHNLVSIDMSGKKARSHCHLGVLTAAFFANTPGLQYVNLSDCNVQGVQDGTFRRLVNLTMLDMSFNQKTGLDLLTSTLRDLTHSGKVNSGVYSMHFDAIVSSSSPGLIVMKKQLEHFPNLTSLNIMTAKFNRITGFEPGALCTHMPPNLSLALMEANLLELAAYVNDLSCMRRLNVLYIDGFSNFWTPPLRAPPSLPSSSDHDPDSMGSPYHGVPIDSRADMDETDPTTKEHYLPKHTLKPKLHQPTITNHLYSSTSNHFRSLKDPATDMDAPSTTERYSDYPKHQFNPAPNMTQLKARHFGLTYKLWDVRVNPDNKLRVIDLRENHLPIWEGHVTGLERLEKLYLVDTYTEWVSDYFFDGFPGLQLLDISGNMLGGVFHRDVTGRTLRGLVNLRNLSISRSDLYGLHGSVFINLTKLEILRLNNNHLDFFNVTVQHMPKLRHLDLSINDISFLPVHVRRHLDTVALTHNVTLDLTFNPLGCYCKNLDFLKWMVETDVHLSRKGHYFCQFPDDSLHYLQFEDLGSTISGLEERCRSFVMLFVFASVCCAVLFVLVLVALGYRFRWKLRYLYYASRLGLMHKKSQEESQQDYLYDAFVSFAGEDVDFISGELSTSLEGERGLRLCIHSRDFVPGQYIASNIVDSVQRSRRTLVVLSRALLESEWCHYELQMALMESAHTGRDVLLFLLYQHVPAHELSRDMLANMQATTHIEFPHEQPQSERALFWDRVAQALRT